MQAEDRLLSHEETLNLLQQAQMGAEDAKEDLFTHNVALVKSVVKKFTGRADYDDLFQLGCMGLVKAINNYDEAYNVRFSTYAVPLIMGEIRRFLRDDGIIKVSRPVKDLYSKAMVVKNRLTARSGEEPGVEEIAKELGVDAEEIVQAMEAAKMPASLNASVREDSGNDILLADCIGVEDDSPSAVDRVMLGELLTTLPARERQIIVMRYFMEKTQTEIAKQLGISQVQVSRMESKIMRKLREAAGTAS